MLVMGKAPRAQHADLADHPSKPADAEAIWEAAGVRKPVSACWSVKAVDRALTDWTEDLGLDFDAILGCIREVRRNRPGVAI